MKLAWSCSRLAPLAQHGAFCRVLQNAAVAIAICNEQIPIPCEGYIGHAPERATGVGHRLNADCEELASGGRILDEPGTAGVCRPNVAVLVDPQAVRQREIAFAP